MPPPLALALTLLFIVFLFRREARLSHKPSPALWIPSIWMLIIGSRSVTEWANLGAPVQSTGSLEEGSPLDRTVFFSLMISGLIVLFKRRVAWAEVFRNNVWMVLFFLYCGISILWSDFPFVAFKRWTKGLGDPIMMLIIMTDPQPIKALETVIKRCAYILLPLSVLFIKYYPHLGRTYSEWTGQASYTGVTTNKNLLGFVCMLCGLFFVWKLAEDWRKSRETGERGDMVVSVGFLFMIGWLFQMSDSKTSLVGLILGSLVYYCLGLRSVRAHVGSFLVVAILVFSVLQVAFDITEIIIASAGRDATLTGRTELWEVLLPMAENPWIGTGYESFWLGDRMAKLSSLWYWKPTQAHNGYIETYLNLGWIGLFILGGVVLSCYSKIRAMLSLDSEMMERVSMGRFGLAFLAVYLVYNITEGAFKSLHFLFVIFLVLSAKYRQPQQAGVSMSGVRTASSGKRNISGTGVRDMSTAR